MRASTERNLCCPRNGQQAPSAVCPRWRQSLRQATVQRSRDPRMGRPKRSSCQPGYRPGDSSGTSRWVTVRPSSSGQTRRGTSSLRVASSIAVDVPSCHPPRGDAGSRERLMSSFHSSVSTVAIVRGLNWVAARPSARPPSSSPTPLDPVVVTASRTAQPLPVHCRPPPSSRAPTSTTATRRTCRRCCAARPASTSRRRRPRLADLAVPARLQLEPGLVLVDGCGSTRRRAAPRRSRT